MAPAVTNQPPVSRERELDALLDLVRSKATDGERAVLRHTLVRILEARSDRAARDQPEEPAWAA